jgi:hypothetical protein
LLLHDIAIDYIDCILCSPVSIVQPDLTSIDDVLEAYNDDEQWKLFLQHPDENHEQCEIVEGLVYVKQGHRLVPDIDELKKRIISEHHSTNIAGHRGVTKTHVAAKQHFYCNI